MVKRPGLSKGSGEMASKKAPDDIIPHPWDI